MTTAARRPSLPRGARDREPYPPRLRVLTDGRSRPRACAGITPAMWVRVVACGVLLWLAFATFVAAVYLTLSAVWK